ncbi:MAG: hypothetical protein M9894_04555 [Planctomycetes bacterium]|nr:hypothetical protein [Planctomycetota bacterium]
MSDAGLRALERAWRDGGGAEAHAAWLRTAVRSGEVDPGRLELAARIGHPAARLACPGAEGVGDEDQVDWLLERLREELAPGVVELEDPSADFDEETYYHVLDRLWPQVGLALARALAPAVGANGLLAAVERWVRQSSQPHPDFTYRRELERAQRGLDSGCALLQEIVTLLLHEKLADLWTQTRQQVVSAVGEDMRRRSLALTLGDWLLEPTWPEPAPAPLPPVPGELLAAVTSQVRSDALPPEQMRLAAYLGHPLAAERVGPLAPREDADVAVFVRGLEPWGKATLVRACLVWAQDEGGPFPWFDEQRGAVPRAAKAVQDWLTDPSPDTERRAAKEGTRLREELGDGWWAALSWTAVACARTGARLTQAVDEVFCRPARAPHLRRAIEVALLEHLAGRAPDDPPLPPPSL